MSGVFVIDSGGAAAAAVGQRTIFGAKNHFYAPTFSGSLEDPAYPLVNAFDFRDNTEFSPNSLTAQVFTISASTVGQLDYIGVLSKNAGTAALTLTVEVYDTDTSAYVEVAELTGFSNGVPKLAYFGDLKTQGYFESATLRLSVTSTSKCYFTAISGGKAVVFETAPSLGFSPAHLSPQDEVEGFTTNGNCRTIGRRIPNGKTAKGVINYMEFDGVDTYWPEFQEHVLNSLPLFFAWSSTKPLQVLYGWQNPKTLARPTYITSFHCHLDFEINGYA